MEIEERLINQGFEFELGWNDSTDGGFSYAVNLNMSTLKNNVSSVDGWERYQKVIADVNCYGDDKDLTALNELGQEYKTMICGNYF